MENDDAKHQHELLRYSGMNIRKVELTMKRNWKILEKYIWLMTIHSYVKLWKTLGMAPGKLEESGKILGKDLWVRAHSKETPLKKITWKGDCTGWIKWLEWDNNLEITWTDWEWKHESSEISSTLRKDEKRRGLSQQWKWFEIDLGKRHVTDGIHSYVTLWKEFGNSTRIIRRVG